VNLNIVVHLKGKRNINVHNHKVKNQPTKTPTNENIEDRGGYPSQYVISEEIVRIRNIAQKTGAADSIRERLNEYGISFDLIKNLTICEQSIQIQVRRQNIHVCRHISKQELSADSCDEREGKGIGKF
jgi:hypothetical protein